MARIKYYDNAAQEWAYADMAVALPPSRLPSAYQEVEYIESDGTGQYIDTGYNVTVNDKIEIDYALTNNSSSLGRLFGRTLITDENSLCVELELSANNKIAYVAKNGALISATDTINADEKRRKFTIDLYLGCAFADNSTIYGHTISGYSYDCNTSLYLFATHRNDSGDIRNQSLKLFRFTISTAKESTLDLIPCYRIADNEIGMYDLVSKTFFTNDGTGTFIKGADV